MLLTSGNVPSNQDLATKGKGGKRSVPTNAQLATKGKGKGKGKDPPGTISSSAKDGIKGTATPVPTPIASNDNSRGAGKGGLHAQTQQASPAKGGNKGQRLATKAPAITHRVAVTRNHGKPLI